LQATITLEYTDVKTAKTIAKAVSPDNLKTLEGLKINTDNYGCKVITSIDCCNGKLSTLTATIDDLLFCVITAEKLCKQLTNQYSAH
jgi:hypothetical protein